MLVPLLIVGALVVVLLCMEVNTRRRVRWGTTPHDQEKVATRRRGSPFARKAYDVFLSYKSEDAEVARHLCEALAGAGLDVWFAEYTILLFNRDQFQSAIDLGASQSRFAIALTNKRYTASQYCRNELDQLLKPENCGPQRIVEIRHPGDPELYGTFPTLQQAHTTDFSTTAAAIESVCDATGLPIDCSVLHQFSGRRQSNRTPFRHADITYSLVLDTWQRSTERDVELGEEEYVPDKRFTFDSPVGRVWLALYVGSKQDTPRTPDSPTSDQKAYYAELLREAEQQYGRDDRSPRAVECLGVHLYRLGGFTHPAFTCFKQPRNWFREYSVIFPDDVQKGRNIRFQFVFSFRGPFRKFAQIAWLLDRLVMSLQLE
jgi:hypothetical protein